ncbi:PKD domain-containing protein [Chryseolinea sp. T2]|uniref:PKD domain-containing protein n=1 Tax=Chryseolinea sp. T2 TaxID=3129255 RepID=UPI0030785E11
MKRLITNSLRSLLLLLLPLTVSLGVNAQNLTGTNWYFGNTPQGVQFSRSDKKASLITSPATAGTGGGAVANSAVNGDLLFYSDGQIIYDVSNQPMPGGSGLGGNSAGNQAVAVAKMPGQDNQYYVFINSATGSTGGGVSYRTVDMSRPGNAVFPNPIPLGEASGSNTGVTGASNTSEAMVVIPQQGTENFWLITHDNGTTTYTVTLFTSAGPQPPATYNVGVITQPGNFAYHAGTNKIAVSPQEANRNVEILDFNPLTGVVSLDQEVPNSAVATVTAGSAVYDTEWSFSGSYLYISSEGEPGVPGNVMQYDVNNPTLTMQSVLPQPNNIYQSYGLQMAPDSSIYHLYQATPGGPFLMGKISDTDSVAANVVYTPQAFPGNVNFGATQFPSFAPGDSADLQISFTYKDTCANTATAFFPTVTPGADSLRWDFGDGSGSSDWSPVYTYEGAGTYDVTVTAYLNGQTATATRSVTIVDFDTQISLVQDTTACSCELPFPKAKNPKPRCGTFSVKASVQGSGTPQLQWFGPGGLIAGATTETLQPDSAGYYYLVATVGNCATYAGVNIKEYDVEDQRANVWYFGNNAGIDFNPNIPNAPVPISNPVMKAPAGTSTISDRNGQVVFFTDGVSVWDRNFTMVSFPPPPGIGGSVNSAQAALIIPVPGDETLYYIFTTKDVYGDGTFELRYSLFDLKMNGGTGGMREENQLLFARSTERLTGNQGWLIAHEYGNNSFRAYPISNLGIGNPVISAVGSDHSVTTAAAGQGYMKLGPNNRLAVALSNSGSNVVEIFDFDNTTGKITNPRTADLNTPTGQVYGVEFSPGGNKLYATLRDGGNSKLVEFALDSLGRPTLMTPPLSTGQELGAIQMGPDGQIYVAEPGKGTLGRIQPSELETLASTYRPGDFALVGGTTSTLGLPNFMQSLADPIQGPFMSIAGQCVQDSVTFSATPTDPIDKFFWQVRLGANVVATSQAQEFNQLFTTPGLYDVSLRLTNRCGLDTTLVQQLRINDLPPDPSGAAVLCTGAAVLDANPTNLPGFTYVWSTGDSTETISVNRRGYYDVTVTNAAGCSTDGRILAADNRPVVDIGDDQTICQNTAVAALDAQNPGMTYAWTLALNGGAPSALGTRRTQAVNTSIGSTTMAEYEVTVTDPVTTCFVKDSVIFTINPLPVITAPVANSIACGSTAGTIDLSITSPASALFTYSITGPSTSITDSDLTVGPIPQATGLAAGTYSITVADQVTTCAVTTAATINNNNFAVAGVPDATCDPINIAATITPTGPPSANYTWRVIDISVPLPPAGQGVQTGTTTTVAFNTNSATTGPIGLPSNSKQYIVEVTDGANCISSSPPIAINHGPKVPALFDVLCDPVAPVSITASQGDTFTWTGPVIISGANAANMKANPAAGTQQYQVLITQAGFCDLDTTLSVIVQPPILANLQDPGIVCGDQVTLNVTPNGNYLYRWYINTQYQAGLGGPQVIATRAQNDGDDFYVTVFSPVTGCQSTSNLVNIQLDGELTVELTSTTPCEGSPFTLTATTNRTATYVWAIDGSTISGQTAATLQDQRGGVYQVTASSASCKATDNIDITLAPVTPGLMNDEAYICPDPANPDPNTRSVVLRPGDFASYDWLKDGVNLGINTPTLTADEPGLYSVLLENSFGCGSSDKTDVLEECDPVIVGPNAFRPTSTVIGLEGDMVNQSFHLYTFFIDDEDFEVFIFNRWGEMIFQSGDRDFRWNGGYKNNLAQLSPAGTYSYLVRYKSSYRPEEGIMEKRGGVVLMR